MNIQDKPKIVVLGGGTGLSVILRGLKNFPVDITAVVAMSDDGGSTGILRKQYGIPALGDIRNVLVSLSSVEPLVEELLQYRLGATCDFVGHPTGNLLLAAMVDITGSVDDGIEALGQVFGVDGVILPATNGNVILMAETTEGEIIEGESYITQSPHTIKRIFYKEEPESVDKVTQSIMEADLIVLGIGSLFTSIIPSLIPADTKEALKKTTAEIVYVCNAMTEPGETDDYNVSDYIRVINEHCDNQNIIDSVIVNHDVIPDDIQARYKEEGSTPVVIDYDNIEDMNVEIYGSRLVDFSEGVVRHKANKLASILYTYTMD